MASEVELDRRVIAREELVEALAASTAETTAVTEAAAEPGTTPAPVPGSIVPPWREGRRSEADVERQDAVRDSRERRSG